MVKCPECKKEISNPQMEFHIGQEENGNQFNYAICSCPGCPQCNYSNTATSSIAKYKEVVYQPCNDIEGQQDHNIKDQMRCDNCHNSFEFYWCAGHNMVENNARSGW